MKDQILIDTECFTGSIKESITELCTGMPWWLIELQHCQAHQHQDHIQLDVFCKLYTITKDSASKTSTTEFTCADAQSYAMKYPITLQEHKKIQEHLKHMNIIKNSILYKTELKDAIRDKNNLILKWLLWYWLIVYDYCIRLLYYGKYRNDEEALVWLTCLIELSFHNACLAYLPTSDNTINPENIETIHQTDTAHTLSI